MGESQSTAESLLLLQHRIREVGDLLSNDTDDKMDKSAKISELDKASTLGSMFQAYDIWPWSYEETLYLLILCQKYNLCWAAIADRYSFGNGDNNETGISYNLDKSKCPIWYDADAWESLVGHMAKQRRVLQGGNMMNIGGAQQHGGHPQAHLNGPGMMARRPDGDIKVDLDEGQPDITQAHSQLNLPDMREVKWPLQR